LRLFDGFPLTLSARTLEQALKSIASKTLRGEILKPETIRRGAKCLDEKILRRAGVLGGIDMQCFHSGSPSGINGNAARAESQACEQSTNYSLFSPSLKRYASARH
jgi:hypothetical protein